MSTADVQAKRPRGAKPDRPFLRHSSFHGGSFIEGHQQYRPPSNDTATTATTATDAAANVTNAVAYLSFSPQPGAIPGRSRRRIKDGDTMTHRLYPPVPDDEGRLVATLFYKAQDLRHPHLHPDQSPRHDPAQSLPAPSISTGVAPTVELNKFPLEPPAPEPEPLDHLYGPYVTQICLTHFLQILNDLQHPWRPMTSSHRCLDSPSQPRVVEVTFSPPPNPEYLSVDDLRRHERLWRFEREWNVEVIIQRDDVWRRHKRLAVFDMDSTLIQQEVIDEMAKVLGVEKEVSAITSRAMNGELDFTSSLRARAALLQGVPADVFERLKSVISITPGARELCRALKALGYRLAVISGGFIPLAHWLADQLQLDDAHANNLVVSDDGTVLTGELIGPIIDAERKATLVEEMAAREGISLQQTLAVGDGANDLPMLKKAGIGLAFNAKPVVQLEAPARLNTRSLLDLLYVLGFTKDEQTALLAEAS